MRSQGFARIIPQGVLPYGAKIYQGLWHPWRPTFVTEQRRKNMKKLLALALAASLTFGAAAPAVAGQKGYTVGCVIGWALGISMCGELLPHGVAKGKKQN
jgi:uncharacterized membrane protein SpoIIM required for sporulation